MSVSTTEEKKYVIQVMKDAGYINKLYYITVSYYSRSSHWRCSGLKGCVHYIFASFFFKCNREPLSN